MLGFNSISSNPFSAVSVTASSNGVAKIVVGPAFSRGFDIGFERGPTLIATATITQEFLHSSLHLSATGTVEKLGVTNIPVIVSAAFNWADTAYLQSQASLSANSVLLLGGVADITFPSTISGKLTNAFDNSDVVDLTLYLDKQMDLSAYIEKMPELAFYLDKQKSVDLYIDRIINKSQYINKQSSFDLMRER